MASSESTSQPRSQPCGRGQVYQDDVPSISVSFLFAAGERYWLLPWNEALQPAVKDAVRRARAGRASRALPGARLVPLPSVRLAAPEPSFWALAQTAPTCRPAPDRNVGEGVADALAE